MLTCVQQNGAHIKQLKNKQLTVPDEEFGQFEEETADDHDDISDVLICDVILRFLNHAVTFVHVNQLP